MNFNSCRLLSRIFSTHKLAGLRQLSCPKMTASGSTINQEKVLLAFDFDHTIINDNSDTYVMRLAPNRKIPAEIEALYSKKGWTDYMGEIFKYLHNHSTTPEQILSCMTEIDFSPGMKELLMNLDKERTEVIIISDSNSIFIDHILSFHGLKASFKRVFTNPARFDEHGRLEIEMFHIQDTCQLSTVNLCKGQVLESYIKERAIENISFSHIAYVGDGYNDFCPSLRLSEKDFVFPRKGYSLFKHIKKMEAEKQLQIKAKVHLWDSGLDILQVLTANIPTLKSNQ